MQLIIDNVESKREVDILKELGAVCIVDKYHMKKFSIEINDLQELFNLRNRLNEPIMLFENNVLVLDYDSYTW